MLVQSICLILLFNCVLSQGIFEPYTFTQSSCNNGYSWTMWFDTNDPNLIQGDLEMTDHIRRLFPGFTCPSPIAIEAQTSIDGSPTLTGDVFRITIKDGFLCLNQQVNNYKNKLCSDYKVRYCCPGTTG